MATNEYALVRPRSEELAVEARRARMAKEARQARMAAEARQARKASVISWRRRTPADRDRLGGRRQGSWLALGQSKMDWSTR
jgi:hypothetical protein